MFCILFFTLFLFIARPSFSDEGGWAATYGVADEEKAYSIQQTSDGGYIVAGWTRSFGTGERDAWVLKLRADGTVEWQKTYGGTEVDDANCIQQTRDGGYIIAGWTSSFSDNRQSDAWVSKLKVDGTLEWQKTYGGVEHDNADYIQQTKDGGYIMAGWTASFGTGSDDFWVLKLRPDGTVEWQRAYGGE